MGTSLPEGFLGQVEALSAEQKLRLRDELRAMIAREFAKGDAASEEVPTCPHCGGTHVIRKGKARDGSQRYLCRECGRTFGASTLSVLKQSKLPESVWMSYAEGMADGLTLRELAKRCGVGLKTSWFMRMRICEAMGNDLDAFRSGPGVYCEVDGTMLHESLSGNNFKGDFEMPRPRRKSGKSVHVKGVSGLLCCVVCAVNDRGDVSARLMGRAHGSIEKIRDSLEGVLEPGTKVATDDLASYDKVLDALGCEHVVRKSKPEKGEKGLGLVNACHKRLGQFLSRFNGVSTRRLQRYLNWWCWTEQFRGGDADRRDLVTREAMRGDYDKTIRGLFEEPRWDMEYWEGKIAA